MTDQSCILVPLHRSTLTAGEWTALTQNRTTLKRYPFIAAAPEGLDIGEITGRVVFDKVLRFEPRFFKSPQTYSRLLVSDAFWEQLTAFEYALIAQLDAVAFSDQLAYWCSQGFDFIGAPWLFGFGANNILTADSLAVIFGCTAKQAGALHAFFQKEGVIDNHNLMRLDYWKSGVEQKQSPVASITPVQLAASLDDLAQFFHSFAGVGSGGFSLRNIGACRKVLRSRSVPWKFNLATVHLEEHPLMKHDLARLKSMCERMHRHNATVIASLSDMHVESSYARTVLELIGTYSPDRSELVFALHDALQELRGHHTDCAPIADVLSQLRMHGIKDFLKDSVAPDGFFWGQLAPLFDASFRVAPIDRALAFAFEHNPDYCYEKNNRQLPFGCHAWQLEHNRVFWNKTIDFLHNADTI